MKKYNTIIFDLDGTLLNTLEDLLGSVNFALKKAGMDLRTLEEIRGFVGNGVRRLVELAVGEQQGRLEEVFQDFKEHYALHCNDKTGPYPGILELLAKLKEKGFQMAIVSNKYYDAVQELNQLYFQEFIPVAIGEKEGINKKPAPDTVEEALRQLGSSRENCVYVGDSEVDIQTAQNAGMDCIVVTWGFRTREEQERAGGRVFVDKPMEILELLGEG
ncbi:MAG: HAD family hydrolase [Lachnospiraceae bacterium]|nr:HAD family hydrolase [Lachnospiraceae bacterium]